jgi:LAO/AO transport system kinase
VWENVCKHRTWLERDGRFDVKRRQQLVEWTRALVRDRLLARLSGVSGAVAQAEAAVLAGHLTPDQAATEILTALG